MADNEGVVSGRMIYSQTGNMLCNGVDFKLLHCLVDLCE